MVFAALFCNPLRLCVSVANILDAIVEENKREIVRLPEHIPAEYLTFD